VQGGWGLLGGQRRRKDYVRWDIRVVFNGVGEFSKKAGVGVCLRYIVAQIDSIPLSPRSEVSTRPRWATNDKLKMLHAFASARAGQRNLVRYIVSE
jgi:hypothetical protein